MSITVFTPTFNRAHTLKRVYNSLRRQTDGLCEWLVVDDGSSDATSNLVQRWQEEASFPIVYIRQDKNRGKHVAFNLAAKRAKGELFVTLDSDDAFLDNVLPTVLKDWKQCTAELGNGLAGLRYLCCFGDGSIVGSRFPEGSIDGRIYEINEKHRVRGDKQTFLLTTIAAEFPFPEFEGERFCPEGIVWNRISRKYKFRHVNTIVQIVEYQADGLSANIFDARRKSPKGACAYYWEASQLSTGYLRRLRSEINLIRFSLHGRVKLSQAVDKRFFPLGRVLGNLIYLLDLIRAR